MEVLIVIVLVVIIAFFLLVAREFYEIARMKGFTESKYFWIPFLFTIYGYLLVIALPDRKQKEVQVKMTAPNTPAKQTARFENDELPDL